MRGLSPYLTDLLKCLNCFTWNWNLSPICSDCGKGSWGLIYCALEGVNMIPIVGWIHRNKVDVKVLPLSIRCPFHYFQFPLWPIYTIFHGTNHSIEPSVEVKQKPQLLSVIPHTCMDELTCLWKKYNQIWWKKSNLLSH